MRQSLKKRLQAGEISLGSMIQFYSPELVEFFGCFGLDFVSIDMEHGAIDYGQLKDMIRAAEAQDMITVVRIPEVKEDPIKKVLDIGVSCLLVPNVETPEQVEELVRHSMYMPRGTRGACPFVRQHRYGLEDNAQCFAQANDDLVLWITLESPASIRPGNMEAMMEVGGFDLISIGAWDMAVAMGVPGQVNHPDILYAREHLEELNARYGKFTGVHVEDPAGLSILRQRLSARMVHLSIMNVLFLKARDHVAEMKDILKHSKF